MNKADKYIIKCASGLIALLLIFSLIAVSRVSQYDALADGIAPTIGGSNYDPDLDVRYYNGNYDIYNPGHVAADGCIVPLELRLYGNSAMYTEGFVPYDVTVTDKDTGESVVFKAYSEAASGPTSGSDKYIDFPPVSDGGSRIQLTSAFFGELTSDRILWLAGVDSDTEFDHDFEIVGRLRKFSFDSDDKLTLADEYKTITRTVRYCYTVPGSDSFDPDMLINGDDSFSAEILSSANTIFDISNSNRQSAPSDGDVRYEYKEWYVTDKGNGAQSDPTVVSAADAETEGPTPDRSHLDTDTQRIIVDAEVLHELSEKGIYSAFTGEYVLSVVYDKLTYNADSGKWEKSGTATAEKDFTYTFTPANEENLVLDAEKDIVCNVMAEKVKVDYSVYLNFPGSQYEFDIVSAVLTDKDTGKSHTFDPVGDVFPHDSATLKKAYITPDILFRLAEDDGTHKSFSDNFELAVTYTLRDKNADGGNPLSVTKKCTFTYTYNAQDVNGSAPMLSVDCLTETLPNNSRHYNTVRVSFAAAGINMNNTSPAANDLRYRPTSWEIVSNSGEKLYNGNFDNSQYCEVDTRAKAEGWTGTGDLTGTLTVKYAEEKFDGTEWKPTGHVETASEYIVLARRNVTTSSTSGTNTYPTAGTNTYPTVGTGNGNSNQAPGSPDVGNGPATGTNREEALKDKMFPNIIGGKHDQATPVIFTVRGASNSGNLRLPEVNNTTAAKVFDSRYVPASYTLTDLKNGNKITTEFTGSSLTRTVNIPGSTFLRLADAEEFSHEFKIDMVFDKQLFSNTQWYTDTTAEDLVITRTFTYAIGDPQEESSGISATAIAVSPTALDIQKGQTSTLTYTLTPAGSTDTVVWSSSDSNVASVDSATGVVTAKATGTATITATVSDTVKATVQVNVFDYISRTVTDSNNRCTISGTIRNDVALMVEPVSDNDATFMKNKVSSSAEKVACWEIYFIRNGQKIANPFTGSVTLSIACDAKYNGKAVKVVHRTSETAATLMDSKVENGKASVTVSSLSQYGVFYSAASPTPSSNPTGSTSSTNGGKGNYTTGDTPETPVEVIVAAWVAGALSIIAAAACIYMLYRNHRVSRSRSHR